MAFHPSAVSGASSTPASTGAVDYRMARHALVAEFRRGRIAQHEVCDAHPELRRVAEHLSRPSRELCPICEVEHLVLVTYAFGPRLPKGGYAIEDLADMEKVRSMTTECTCYVIEVCTACGWNHLLQTFPVKGGRQS